MIRFSNVELTKIHDLLIDTDAPLDGATLRLFTGSPDIDKDMEAADFTAPTFTGYTDAALTFVEQTDANGRKYLSAGPTTETPTNNTNLPMSITGAAILDADGAVFAAGNFTTPIVLTFAGQLLHTTPKIVIGDSEAVIEGYVD